MDREEQVNTEGNKLERQFNAMTRYQKFQYVLYVVIILSALTGVGIGLMRKKGLDASALLYIGLPTAIALMVAGVGKAGSITGETMKWITFVILVSGPLLQEGFLCMILAAPILYMVGALAALPFDLYIRKKRQGKSASKVNVMVLPVILMLMSLEGVNDELSFNRLQTVEKTLVIQADMKSVLRRLGETRRPGRTDSLFLHIFPKPEVVKANGLYKGSTQTVELSYLKWVYWNEKRGSTQFEAEIVRPDYIKFQPIHDDSYISSYLDWRETEVFLVPLGADKTQVSWRINYSRKLDPAWYVQPLQQYAVGKTAEALLASLQ